MPSLLNDVDTWRHVIKQNIETLNRLAFDQEKIFEPGEQYVCEPDSDGLGVRVSVASTSARADALLKQIQKQAFPRFAFTGVHLDDGLYYTHFRAVI